MTRPVALLDANVLFSASLRDTLLWPAFARIYQARFTNQIHEEWIRAVLKQRPHLARASLEATRDLMNAKIPGALVEGYQGLIEGLQLPDPNDRHVLAAAIHSGCDRIVTWNSADFPAFALGIYGLKTQSPDAFLLELTLNFPQDVVDSLRRQRANLSQPPLSVERFIENLRNQNLPQFVKAVEPYENDV